MLVSFLVVLPLCIGLLVNGILRLLGKEAPFRVRGGITTASILLLVFAAGVVFKEGAICILMALPLVLLAGLIGSAFQRAEKHKSAEEGEKKSDSIKKLGAVAMAPFAVGLLEGNFTSPDSFHLIREFIEIDATPDVVWRHINFPTDIRREELRGGVAYLIGVPYPLEARTIEGRVGGLRELKWERGIAFSEQITAWEPNRHIAWKYIFSKDSFPPGSLDDHIVIGGQYFDLKDTSYTLHEQEGKTKLEISVNVRVSTNFNWYAGLWTNFLVADTARTILKFYKARSELDVQSSTRKTNAS